MSIRKRNEFMDGDESEEDSASGYRSDEAEESRGASIRRASKRHKADNDESEDSLGELDDEAPKTGLSEEGTLAIDPSTSTPKDEAQTSEDGFLLQKPTTSKSSTKPGSKSSHVKQAEKAQKAVRKSGVVYISRVPPFMKPHTLRHFLEPHTHKGLGRIFLTPEEHASYQKRVKNGGNKKRSFTDGWVEFASKTEAKRAAEILNGNIIGGKKGNFYYDDIWNIKYLSSFKWHHLTEQVANENAERASRLREEIRRTRQENKAFVEDIEKAKMLEGMESKRKAKLDPDTGDPADSIPISARRPGRDFKQRKVQSKEAGDGTAKPGKDLNRVLSKIF